MTEKLRKCGECRERAVSPAVVEYVTSIDHDGRSYAVRVPNLAVFKCGKCGDETLGAEALEKVEAAFRRTAGLLSPEEIKRQRAALKLTQKQLAKAMRIADSTLCRWETGVQVQQAGYDEFLRQIFKCEALRRSLGIDKRKQVHSTETGYEFMSFPIREYDTGVSYNMTRGSSVQFRETTEV
jgi:DNA-binding transcriptional regulator YiaG